MPATEPQDKYNRSPTELENLARDPAHGNQVEPKGIHERKVVLELENQGKLPGPVKRDPTGAAEFIDTDDTKWDIKSFDSRFPPKKGGFKLERDLGKVEAELAKGENVIIDTTNLKPEHAKALRQVIEDRGLFDRIQWYPKAP